MPSPVIGSVAAAASPTKSVRAVVQNRTMAAQAIPSYAPHQAAAHFNKLECFCFNQYTLAPGEKKQWPVSFVIDV